MENCGNPNRARPVRSKKIARLPERTATAGSRAISRSADSTLTTCTANNLISQDQALNVYGPNRHDCRRNAKQGRESQADLRLKLEHGTPHGADAHRADPQDALDWT